ncbi:MAG: hypothetical protein ACK4PR_08825, partial [Gammaproteobacteria bacterium]
LSADFIELLYSILLTPGQNENTCNVDALRYVVIDFLSRQFSQHVRLISALYQLLQNQNESYTSRGIALLKLVELTEMTNESKQFLLFICNNEQEHLYNLRVVAAFYLNKSPDELKKLIYKSRGSVKHTSLLNLIKTNPPTADNILAICQAAETTAADEIFDENLVLNTVAECWQKNEALEKMIYNIIADGQMTVGTRVFALKMFCRITDVMLLDNLKLSLFDIVCNNAEDISFRSQLLSIIQNIPAIAYVQLPFMLNLLQEADNKTILFTKAQEIVINLLNEADVHQKVFTEIFINELTITQKADIVNALEPKLTVYKLLLLWQITDESGWIAHINEKISAEQISLTIKPESNEVRLQSAGSIYPTVLLTKEKIAFLEKLISTQLDFATATKAAMPISVGTSKDTLFAFEGDRTQEKSPTLLSLRPI